jgi:conjugal transfer pilin signal peptidase TrbI
MRAALQGFTNPNMRRERLASFRNVVREHLKQHWLWWSLLLAAILVFNAFFKIGINASSSLPGHVYVVVKGDRDLHRGDYAAFVWHGGGPYPAGLTFLKIVRGLPGDTVFTRGREFFVMPADGVLPQSVGIAKPKSKTGQPLAMGPTGVIPQGRYYVFAPNPDSLDSRYALAGWVRHEDIVGRAYFVF